MGPAVGGQDRLFYEFNLDDRADTEQNPCKRGATHTGHRKNADNREFILERINSGGFLILPFNTLHILVTEAEVVSNFVDQDVADKMVQVFAAVALVFQNGAAVEGDHIDVVCARCDAFLIQRHAIIQSQQIKRRRQAQGGLGFTVGEFLDPDDDVVHMGEQFAGHGFQGLGGDGLYFIQ